VVLNSKIRTKPITFFISQIFWNKNRESLSYKTRIKKEILFTQKTVAFFLLEWFSFYRFAAHFENKK
tara:strand:+ start:70 stop:270 length:201 start_codon:yes stop_codon:yes gene_type:complete